MPHNEDGVGGMHLYMPWWLDNRKLDFPRGYHIEIGGGRGMPGYGFVRRHPPLRAPGGGGYGKQLKDDYRRYYGATVGFAGRGEMIPNEDTYCEIDPTVVDAGASRCCASTGSGATTSCNQVKHMQETFRAIIAEMGGDAALADAAGASSGLRHRSRAAASSTSWARRAWATTRDHRC